MNRRYTRRPCHLPPLERWVGVQVRKYDWDIDPDDADHPTIHGLRGTGILARAEQGYEVDQIANDIGSTSGDPGLGDEAD